MIMLRKFSNILKKLWNGHKENFLIIEQRNGGYDVTVASRDLAAKRLFFKKRFFAESFGKLRRPLVKPDKIVLSLDERSATTAESIVALERAQPTEAIDETEMDQLVYQAFWDFLNRYRGLAAKKMGVADESLVMAYIQIREVYLGAHRIFNPLGFKGNRLSLRLRGTFISRDTLSSLERLKNWGHLFVFEKGSVLISNLPEKRALLAVINGENTAVFKKSEEESVFIAAQNWGTDSFAKRVAAELGLDESTAQIIVDRYFIKKVSARVERRLETEINADLSDFSKVLERLKKKSGLNRPSVFFTSRYSLLASAGQSKKIGWMPLRIDEELARREFILKKEGGAADFDPAANQETLALLSFEYDLPKFEALNRSLKRRVRWLIPDF